MEDFIKRLDWVQRQIVAVALYKNDWRAAVAAVPEPLRAELKALCDKNNLHDLARLADPATVGVLVRLNDPPCYFP